MKTGVFDLPMPDYLASHGVSQSMLKLLSKSPSHLKYSVEHPSEPTDAQILGTIAHKAVFEPGDLETCCHVKPPNYTNLKNETKKWDGRAKECKDWLFARRD